MAQSSVEPKAWDATVLVVRFSALGDVAMTIPVLYSACECYPSTRFVMVTKKNTREMFVNAPANLEVVGVDIKDDYVGIGGMRRLIADLCEKYSPNTLIDLHDVLRTKLMRIFARLRGMKVETLNKGRSNKRALTRRHGKVMLPLTTSRARYREAFYNVGYPIDLKFNGLYGNGKAPVADFAKISGPKPEGEKWVGIAPFAAHQGKIYPADMMDKVVGMVAARGDCRIFIFGAGEKERAVAEEWEKKYPCVASLADKRFGFKAELALLSHIDAMVTMDSANMHLAALTRTPTISIWGATHFYCGFKGWRQSESDMVQLPLPCRPCSVFGNKKCFRGDWLCLTGIRPEVIYDKIAGKL
ncbi:MAG: glycosyltransferase family 9 protein [Clostridium sp.]|nr:glycosyltransferase family 9 protein [Clostridium sp.]